MKTSLVKLMMPVAAFVLASAGAVTTSVVGSTGNAAPPERGWHRYSMEADCESIANCRTEPGEICTSAVTGDQAFKLVGSNCSELLFKP